MPPARVFFGFSSAPEPLADTLRTAANEIDRLADVDVANWENFRIGGTVLLETIETEIRSASVCVLDLTQLNENVVFEFGMAVGADKVVWPLRDASDMTRAAEWKALGLFDTVGQTRFTNSDQIQAAFKRERPDLQGSPLFSSSLADGILGGRVPSLFYVAETYQTDAGRRVLQILETEHSDALPLVIDDPSEVSVQTMSWYAQQVYSAEVVVVHLAPSRRAEAALHNARASFVAGLARGMKRPLLMLAEADHVAALDYKDLLYRYPSAAECGTRVTYWLGRNLGTARMRVATAEDEAEALRFSTELRSVDLGEYVAENEASGLSRYFVETATIREVLSGASRVYVGAKGSGKSASAMQGAVEIQCDKRDLVCVIKPAGYDLDGLVALLDRYKERDARGYMAESLWKFLLATELALAVERDLGRRAAGIVPNAPEWALAEFVAEHSNWVKTDFASRLERVVESILAKKRLESTADERVAISEALHAGPLAALRRVLGPALAARRRTFIIIDNLDKAWDAGADASSLARVILGLLSCMDAFRQELARSGKGEDIDVSLSLFMRSDTFQAVAAQAREPDKLPVRRLVWNDPKVLLHVVEERYVASRQVRPPQGELWTRYFCESVGGTPVRDWVTNVCIARPRDVLYLCRAAIDKAVSARHGAVEPVDLEAAEHQYSLFAFEAVAVECQQRFPRSESVLIEFAGMPTQLTQGQLRDVLSAGGADAAEHPAVIDALRDVGFLGVLADVGRSAVFADTAREKERTDVLARRRGNSLNEGVRFEVHRAFWAYLELKDVSRTPNLGV
jgi:hypothetical protein